MFYPIWNTKMVSEQFPHLQWILFVHRLFISSIFHLVFFFNSSSDFIQSDSILFHFDYSVNWNFQFLSHWILGFDCLIFIMSEGTNQRNIQENSDDPYCIHHSDNPGTVLVSQILTGDNYSSWSRAMTIALSVKIKLDFIDGTTNQPPTIDIVWYKSWSCNNNIIISWILNSISKEIAASVIYLKTAKDIWKELNDRFQQSNGPRIFQIKRDIMNVT